MEMVSDNRGARVVVDGPNEQDLTRLVRQIAYLNTRFDNYICTDIRNLTQFAFEGSSRRRVAASFTSRRA